LQNETRKSLFVLRLKLALLAGGVVIAAIGLSCLPVGFGVCPKRDLSLFNNLPDLSVFIKAALALIPLGLIAVVLSYFLPGPEVDE